MKYSYHFEEIKLANNSKSLVIRLEEEIKLVETFLIADIQDGASSYDWVTEKINLVLEGKSEFEEICGNICCLEISNTNTKVVDSLNPDESNNSCMIETSELRKLIDIWVAKYREQNK